MQLENGRPLKAQVFPEKLVDAILDGVRREAKARHGHWLLTEEAMEKHDELCGVCSDGQDETDDASTRVPDDDESDYIMEEQNDDHWYYPALGPEDDPEAERPEDDGEELPESFQVV